MTRQVGNEIDEFVTSALRNNLLGLPLDLATINLARGRDTGVPSLNAARREFYEATDQNALLKPYESWVDFAGHLKNEASIINFIAAYGTHALITGADDGRRQARRGADASSPVTSDSAAMAHRRRPTQSTSSTRPAPMPAASLGGLDNVDLWIGGLAEEIMPFGGMLGSTFNFVFEDADGEPAERRPLLLPAAARRPASVRRDGGQFLRRDDHAQHRRDAPAVRRVLDARPDPRGRPDQAVQRSRTATAILEQADRSGRRRSS